MADAGKGPTNRQLFLFRGDVAPKVGDILDTSESFVLPSQLDLVDPLTERIVVGAREEMTPPFPLFGRTRVPIVRGSHQIRLILQAQNPRVLGKPPPVAEEPDGGSDRKTSIPVLPTMARSRPTDAVKNATTALMAYLLGAPSA